MRNICKISFMLLAFGLMLNAKELYVTQDTNIKTKDGELKVFVGLPINVVKKNDKNSQVSIRGYLDKNKLYFLSDKSLMLAQLPLKAKTNIIKDNLVSYDFTIENQLLTDKFKEIWDEQEELFYDACSQCHAAPVVEHHTMSEWTSLLQTMSTFANLDKKETIFLERFLKSNAKNGVISKK